VVDRRRFLRAAGVSLLLPALEAWAPRPARAAAPRRAMLCVCAPLGLHLPNLVPAVAGPNYVATPYLEPLQPLRQDFTVISGLAHPEIESSHDSAFSFLTAAPHPERRAGFRNSISLDQLAAEKIGGLTRFPSLCLAAEGFGLSWTRSGAQVPSEGSPARAFTRLFLGGRPEEVRAQARRLREGRSILDSLREQVGRVTAGLGSSDRQRLDEYFTGIRELEGRMAIAESWLHRPRPPITAAPPTDAANPADVLGKTRLFFDLAHLALQSDSTRLITLMLLGTSQVPPIPGVTDGHHNLSHHGQDPGKLRQLALVELETMRLLAGLLEKLRGSAEEGGTVLDRTMVLFGSNLGNANSHSCRNLPILFAGGGFRHGTHLAFDPAKPPPLSNLYVTMLQRLGLETDRFGSGNGTLAGMQVRA